MILIQISRINREILPSIYIVCKQHNLKFTTSLVKQLHCSPNIFNNENELPIHIAASHSLSLVKAVTCSPEYVNSQNLLGDTPLHIACRAAEKDSSLPNY